MLAPGEFELKSGRRHGGHNAPDVQVARDGARANGGGAKGAEKAAYLKAIAHGVNDREMAL